MRLLTQQKQTSQKTSQFNYLCRALRYGRNNANSKTHHVSRVFFLGKALVTIQINILNAI